MSENEQSANEILSALAIRIAESVHAARDEWDETLVAELVHAAIVEVVIGQGNSLGNLSRGEVHAFFGTLAKLAGVQNSAFAEGTVGTHKILNDEFEFEGFTPRGTPSFRHRTTNRVLYAVLEREDLLLGMLDPQSDQFSAFVHTKDALSWVRGGDPGKRITNMLWTYP